SDLSPPARPLPKDLELCPRPRPSDSRRAGRVLPPAHPLRSAEQEQASLWDTPLTDHMNQNTLKFALGKRPLSEWDDYVTELKAKNMQQLVDLHNKAYERYKKDNG
ncbi:hypothetical protein ACWCRC_41650, partial [Streptomyces sp. NPDC001940]